MGYAIVDGLVDLVGFRLCGWAGMAVGVDNVFCCVCLRGDGRLDRLVDGCGWGMWLLSVETRLFWCCDVERDGRCGCGCGCECLCLCPIAEEEATPG